MKITLPVGIIVLFIFLVCDIYGQTKINTQIHSIEMNSAEEKNMEEIVTNVEYIQLENSSEAFMYGSWKIKLYKNFVYIYSLSDFSIFIFSNKGKLVNKLDSRSKGKINYPVDFYINTLSEELWVVDERTTIKKYSLSGKEYLGNIKLPFQTTAIGKYSKNKFLLYDGNFNKNIPGYIGLIDLNNNSSTSFFAMKSKTKKFNCTIPPTLFTSDNNGNTYSLLPNNDTIYISNNEVGEFEPFIYLNFKGDFLNEEKWPKEGFSDKAYEKMMKSKKFIYDINSFYIASNKLFLKTEGKKSNYYYYDLSTKKIYTFDKLFDNLITETPATSIQGSNSDQLFFIFDAKHLLSHYKKSKKSQYPNINQLVANLSKDDNKIILICTIKK